jgi:hypothetical protein
MACSLHLNRGFKPQLEDPFLGLVFTKGEKRQAAG